MSFHIDADGYPLGFEVAEASKNYGLRNLLAGQDARETFRVEARHMHIHQKEALVTQGETGSLWRLTSDEGVHLKGTNLAPFPLGFFNAGIQGELISLIVQLSNARGVPLESIRIKLANHYWLTGSFVLGTGEGHAEPSNLEIDIDSNATDGEVADLMRAVLQASGSLAMIRTPLTNTFAIYLNGVRRQVVNLNDSAEKDVRDPFLRHQAAPRPLRVNANAEVIEKLSVLEDGQPLIAPSGTTTKIVRGVYGQSSWTKGQPFSQAESWLSLPGTTHFAYRMDIDGAGGLPAPQSMLTAGIAFCFMTQLSRYIENMKLAIDGIRLVQFCPFEVSGMTAKAQSIDTHLFLNGSATEEVCTNLLRISEKTCYLHATATSSLDPTIKIMRKGQPLVL
jgi:uncharacterized OsmC-like protein